MTSRSKSSLSIVVAVVLIAGLAAGGYLLGKSSGEDIDAAREHGMAIGKAAGSALGATQGRQAGTRAGFARGYTDAYREAYQAAGVDAPEKIEVPAQ
jgi:hypothetical protein